MLSNRNFRNILNKLQSFHLSTDNKSIVPANFINRNPRNLEKLRIGYKPDGFHVDRPGKSYWHNLKLEISGRYATAIVEHFENGDVLKASTQEWCIKKQLYKPKDTAAFINLGRVLAERCLKSGLTELNCNIEPPKPDGKIAKFLQAVEEGGVALKEPPQFKPWRPWDQHRPDKPWEITE